MTRRELERLLAKVSLFAVPGLLFAVLLLVVAWLHPDNFQTLYGLIIVFMFTPAGKFTASVFISQGMGVWETVWILGTVDVLVGLFLILNFDVLYRIPRLGPRVARMETKGRILLEERNWIRRAAFLGLCLVVAVPFQGTGAVAGAIAGRLLGIGKGRTLGAIAVGGFGGVAVVAGATEGIAAVGRSNLGLAIGLLAVLGIGLLLLLIYWRNHKGTGRPDAE